ncbi:hypothetical protein ACLOJK_008813 [Asimina triloba]
MATPPSFPRLFLSFSLSLFLFAAIVAHAQVPKSKQFRWVNQGEMGPYLTEFGAWYRLVLGVEGFFSFPFQAMFYNTTPDAHVFGIRMGRRRGENTMRWVWDANRNRPVRENATLTFGRDGNLVLADADGSLVWHTNTANKGVTGLRMLPTGNLVLYDKNNRFLWQSFDHPTDTLLVGQTIRVAAKLVSRTSLEDGSHGPFSVAVTPEGFLMQFTHAGVALPYGGWSRDYYQMETVTLAIEPVFVENRTVAHFLSLKFQPKGSIYFETFDLVRVYYKPTYSFLRISPDGNLRTFTYNTEVVYGAWQATFSFLAGNEDTYPFYSFGYDRRCGSPTKCGSFGLCREGMCVACPQRQGMLGWSESCAPPKLPTSSCSAGAVDYYRIDGVEHFVSREVKGEGPMKEEACREKCSKDCKCVGFFYWRETSKCWLAPVLGTLRKAEESSHVGYIKVSK